MRTKKPHIPTPHRMKRKLFGKKIKSENLSIPDTTISFYEDMPLYRGKPSRRLGRKHTHRTRKTSPQKNT